MRWVKNNWSVVALVAIFLTGEWFLEWQPIARECRRRGGSYTLVGVCSRMNFQIIFTKHDLK